jgi:hypothetical protein
MANAKKTGDISIRPIQIKHATITIVGKTPLIVHAWSHKAKQEMLDKQRGKKVTAKHATKIPFNDFIESLYWLTEKPELGKDDDEAGKNAMAAINGGARFGFPVTGIKQAIVTGAGRSGLDAKQTELRGSFFLHGATDAATAELAEIEGDAPQIREDMVRLSGMSKSADIRYRGEFVNWKIRMIMDYNAEGKYSLEQLLNFINYGGFCTGIGEWRPEKDGQNGMFELLLDSDH